MKTSKYMKELQYLADRWVRDGMGSDKIEDNLLVAEDVKWKRKKIVMRESCSLENVENLLISTGFIPFLLAGGEVSSDEAKSGPFNGHADRNRAFVSQISHYPTGYRADLDVGDAIFPKQIPPHPNCYENTYHFLAGH